MDEFTLSFLETALFCSIDEQGLPMNLSLGTENIDPETLAQLQADCQKFQESREWQDVLKLGNNAYIGSGLLNGLDEQGGHDFFLTRCHDGAGFWDGDWKEPHAGRLTTLAQTFADIALYVGDDGKVYCGQ